MHERTKEGLVQLRASIANAVLTLNVIAAAPTTEAEVLSGLVGIEPQLMDLRAQVNAVLAGRVGDDSTSVHVVRGPVGGLIVQ